MLLLLFFVALPQAQANEINKFISTLEEKAQTFDDQALQDMYNYRKEVEAHAYENTMKLCANYLRIKRNNPRAHELVKRYHGGFMISAEESALEWAKIVQEGAQQPISAGALIFVDGMKADYIARKNLGFFDFETWFKSMYSIFLVNSMGFLGASMHCLGTMDQDEINDFAATIMITDAEASLAVHAGTFFAGGLILRAILKATRFVWSPIGKGLGMLATAIGTPKLKLAGMAIGYVTADNFAHMMKQRAAISEYAADFLDAGSELRIAQARGQRFVLLDLSLKIIERSTPFETDQCDDGIQAPACQELYKDFINHVIEQYSPEILDDMEEDRKYIQSRLGLSAALGNGVTETERAYHALLNGFLGVVKKFYENI